jgi:hypothetical protein|tara:strand:+ start:10770 stop:11435 length:666 start_codon:yes stop_codon:yes gene_type:complete
MGLVIDRMNWLSSNIVAVALMLLIAVSSYGATQKVYRYTNSAGTKVINDVIPPEYADKGYEVITYEGEVITVVPPQKTDSELNQARLETERLQTEQAEQKRLRQWDESLLLRYSQVDEISQAKNRALRVIDVAISLNKNSLKKLKKDIEVQQVEAAQLEREGEEISETRRVTLIAFKNELQLVVDSIDRRLQEKITVARDYEADIERFKMLRQRLELYQKR